MTRSRPSRHRRDEPSGLGGRRPRCVGSPAFAPPGAPDDMDQAHRTQVWLATGNDPEALVTGRYCYHMRPRSPDRSALDTALQDRLLKAAERLSSISLPE